MNLLKSRPFSLFFQILKIEGKVREASGQDQGAVKGRGKGRAAFGQAHGFCLLPGSR